MPAVAVKEFGSIGATWHYSVFVPDGDPTPEATALRKVLDGDAEAYDMSCGDPEDGGDVHLGRCVGYECTCPVPVGDAEPLPGPWDNDPAYPRADWQYEVANNDTALGYVAWVTAQRAAAAEVGK